MEAARLTFRGLAKVHLGDLKCAEAAKPPHREISEKNIRRLVKVFELEGCRRDDHKNFVDAIVGQHELEKSSGSFLQDCRTRWTDVAVQSLKLDVVNGFHRIFAAERYLDDNDKWWVVRLHTAETPQQVTVELAEEFSHEQSFSDGEIFRKIRHYHMVGDETAERRWWARLTPTKTKDLKQLLRNDTLAAAFDSLLQWPGLWSAVKIGSLHRLLTMKCDEEMATYLMNIRGTWSTIMSGSAVTNDAADTQSVRILQSLLPTLCKSDWEHIESEMAAMRLFPAVPNESDRAALLRNIRSIQLSIPSLHTFFEGLKYLEPGAKALRQLLPPGTKRTIRCALAASYFRPGRLFVQHSPYLQTQHPGLSPDTERALSYQQLWLFALRNFPSMVDMAPRKGTAKEKPRYAESNARVWQQFGSLAVSMGFKTTQTRRLMDQDADRELAHQLIQKLLPDAPTNARVLDQVTAVFKNLEGGSAPLPDPQFYSDKPRPIERRVGRPFEDDFVHDRPYLFVPWIFARPPAGGAYPSSFLCTWTTLRLFLGQPQLDALPPAIAQDCPMTGATVGTNDCPGCAALQRELDGSSAKAKALEGRMEEIRLETQKQLENGQCRSKSIEDELSAARDEISLLRSESATRQNDLELERSRAKHLEHELAAARDEISLLRSESATYQSDLELERSRAKHLEHELAAARDEMSSMHPLSALLQAQIDSIRTEWAAAEATHESKSSSLHSEIDSLRKTCATTERELHSSRLENESIRKEMQTKLDEASAASQSSVAHHSTEMDSLRGQNASLQEDVRVLKEQERATIENTARKVEQLESALQSERDAYYSLEVSIPEMEAKLEAAEKHIQDLEADVSSKNAIAEAATLRSNALETRVRELQDANDEASRREPARSDETQREIDCMISEAEELRSQIKTTMDRYPTLALHSTQGIHDGAFVKNALTSVKLEQTNRVASSSAPVSSFVALRCVTMSPGQPPLWRDFFLSCEDVPSCLEKWHGSGGLEELSLCAGSNPAAQLAYGNLDYLAKSWKSGGILWAFWKSEQEAILSHWTVNQLPPIMHTMAGCGLVVEPAKMHIQIKLLRSRKRKGRTENRTLDSTDPDEAVQRMEVATRNFGRQDGRSVRQAIAPVVLS